MHVEPAITSFLSLFVGFNCGEAVNFAIGDWFPLGAIASKRYAFLTRVPLLPHEELLCNEAMLLYKNSMAPEFNHASFSQEDFKSNNCTKESFVELMRCQHRFRWLFTKSKSCVRVSTTCEGTVLCSVCNCDCYVAYVSCQRCSLPICLHHGNKLIVL